MLESKGLTIEQRLAKLERTARRWRLAALGLAGCVVCVVGMGAADDPFPKVVKANMFYAEDENGNPIGFFGVAKRGDVPNLILIDKNGKGATTIQPGVEGFKVVTPEGKTVFID